MHATATSHHAWVAATRTSRPASSVAVSIRASAGSSCRRAGTRASGSCRRDPETRRGRHDRLGAQPRLLHGAQVHQDRVLLRRPWHSWYDRGDLRPETLVRAIEREAQRVADLEIQPVGQARRDHDRQAGSVRRTRSVGRRQPDGVDVGFDHHRPIR